MPVPQLDPNEVLREAQKWVNWALASMGSWGEHTVRMLDHAHREAWCETFVWGVEFVYICIS